MGGIGSIEHVEYFGNTEVGIVDTDEGSVDGMLQYKVASDEDGGGFTFVDIVGVFGVGEEGDASFVYFFDATGFPDEDVGVAFDGAFEFLGYLLGCELHVR